MITRVVFTLVAAAIAVPAAAAQRLPYDFADLVYPSPGPPTDLLPAPPPVRAPMPRIGYDMGGLLYNRTPDHVALGYSLEGLTGRVPAYRVIRDFGPLDYDIDGLLAVIYAEAPDGMEIAAD